MQNEKVILVVFLNDVFQIDNFPKLLVMIKGLLNESTIYVETPKVP